MTLKNGILSLVIFCFAWPVMAAETLPDSFLPGWNTIQPTILKKDISFLASDALQGRLALQQGDQKAINWIAEQFQKAGLKPLTRGYLQAVELIEFFPDYQQNKVGVERAGKVKYWKRPDIYTEFYQDKDIKGELVFAGYGITAPALQYDDYENIDVRGKIVLIFEHEPEETNRESLFNGIANTIYATNRIKILNAQKHGALAVLIAPEPNRKHPSNQERYRRIGGKLDRKMLLPSMVLVNDQIQIPVAIISDAVANEIVGPHISLSRLQSEIDKNYHPASLVIPDTKMSFHERNKSQRQGVSYNVVGLLEGSDPVLKQETIIISAHHDHDGKHKDFMWPGADDDASGTAGVVALAHAFSTNSQSQTGSAPKRSILFVVFASEERGLLGSFYMTAHPLRSLATTRAMINLDMIGRNESHSNQTKGLITIPKNTANRLNLIGSHYSPTYDKIIKRENQFVGLEIDNRFDNDAALNMLFRSDQFPFLLHQIPAFWWFTGYHPDYHQPTDTADKINYEKMQSILRLAYLSAYAFANETKAPAFIDNP